METVSLFESCRRTETTRQILHIEMLVQKENASFFLLFKGDGGWGGCSAAEGEPWCVWCCLRELFILRVHSLWRSERRQTYSSYSACR